MKKLLIAALVGSLIMFVWQSISFMALDLHGGQMDYTSQQDVILKALNESGISEGDYMIPRAPRGASEAELEASMSNIGKPWAIVKYRKNLQNEMGMNLFRGWACFFLSMLLLAWLMSQMKDLTITKAILVSLSVGFIGYMLFPYGDSIWFGGNTMPDLIDSIVPWAVSGAWMGWLFNR